MVLGRNSGCTAWKSDTLYVWRRIRARLARHPTKDRRPSRRGGEGARPRAELPARARAPVSAALDDAVRAYEWLLTQGAEPSRMVAAGDSAGGGLAISTVMAVRNRGLPMLAGIVTLSPWTDFTCSGEYQ